MKRLLILCLLGPVAHAAQPVIAPADALAARLQAVTPVASVPLAALQALPEALLQPRSLQPAWGDYPLAALRQLAHYQQQCQGSLGAVAAAWQQFARAYCRGQPLPAAWWAAHPVHPLGGSSAGVWRQRWPQGAPAAGLHLRERRDALAPLAALSDDKLDALLAGERWLRQDDSLWWLHDGHWRQYRAVQWQPLLAELGWQWAPAGSSACQARLGRDCLQPLPPSPWPWRLLGVLLVAATAISLLWLAWQRRRLERERRRALQLLTHELRTPITGLAGVVEQLRSQFDLLPPAAQHSFGQLAGGVARLRQLAEASRHYLGAGHFVQALQPVPLADWLDGVAERHQCHYCLQQDVTLLLTPYWLTLCLDNLLANARRHGQAPWQLHAAWDGRLLTLHVTDAGRLPHYRLHRLLRRGSAGDGMGLGLGIVADAMRRMGGRLRLSGPPTTFTLCLPARQAESAP